MAKKRKRVKISLEETKKSELEKKISKLENKVFDDFNKERVQNIYLAVLFLFFMAHLSDYYLQLESYLSLGAQDSLLSFGVLGILLFYIGRKFFDFFYVKCQKIQHVFCLFLIPFIFFEMAIETYHKESLNFNAFDRWQYHYQKGLIFFHKTKDFKKAKFYFLKSIIGLAGDEKRQVLFLKSQVYLTMIKIQEGHLDEKTKKSVEYLYQRVKKRPSREAAMVSYMMAHMNNNTKDFNRAYQEAEKCLAYITKKLRLPKDDLFHSCLMELALVNIMEKDGDEAIPRLKRLFAYYKKTMRQNQRESLKNLFMVLKLLKLSNQLELELDYQLETLDLLRGGPHLRLLEKIYHRLHEIYSELNSPTQSQIFAQKRDEMRWEIEHQEKKRSKKKDLREKRHSRKN